MRPARPPASGRQRNQIYSVAGGRTLNAVEPPGWPSLAVVARWELSWVFLGSLRKARPGPRSHPLRACKTPETTLPLAF